MVATPIMIGAPIIFATSHSGKQDVKNAKKNLEKLTAAQKTVDLTNKDNQKLPSKIAPRIKSIKALNDLIKGVIVEPNGVRYTPKVVSYKDETKGEMVVEIEIKKGLDIDKFKFTITGFITKAESQADKTDVENALAKINDSTISGDISKLPSAIKLASIKDLSGFPPTIANGVHFSATLKSHNDEDGTIIITLIATKRSAREEKAITISNFKKEIKVSKVTTSTLNVEASKLKKENLHFNKKPLNFEKTASNHINPEKISGFGLSAGTTLVASKGSSLEDKLTITYKLKNGSVTSNEQTVTISGFKKEAVILLNLQAQALEKKDFEYNNLSFDKEKAASNYNDPKKVSLEAAALSGATLVVSAIRAEATNIIITYKLTKSGNSSDEQTMTIPGFKAAAVIALNAQAQTLETNNFKYDSVSFDKNKAASNYNDPKKVSLEAAALSDATLVVSAIRAEATNIIITYKLTKSGNSSDEQTMTIPCFKAAAVIALNAQAQTLETNNFKYDSVSFDKEKAASNYNDPKKVSLEAAALSDATLVVSAIRAEATNIIITYKLTKSGNSSDEQTMTIPGFKAAAVIALNAQAQTLETNNFKYDSVSFDKNKAASNYNDPKKVSLEAAALSDATLVVSAIRAEATNIIITYKLTKSGNSSDEQTMTIPCFKAAAVIALNAQAQTLETNNFKYDSLSFDKEKAASNYNDPKKVSLEAAALSDATLVVSAIRAEATNIIITYKLTKSGNSSDEQTMTIPGFKAAAVIALNAQAQTLETNNFKYDSLSFDKEKAASNYNDPKKVSLEAAALSGATLVVSAIRAEATNIIITYKLTKSGNSSDEQTMTIPGFKAAAVIALNAQAQTLETNNFKYDSLSFDKEKAASNYNDPKKVSLEAAALSGATLVVSAIRAEATNIIITYKLTKSGNSSDEQTMTIPGFKAAAVIALNAQAQTLETNNFKYDSVSFDKEKAASNYNDPKKVSLEAAALSGATLVVSAIRAKATNIIITYKLTKSGNSSDEQTMTIPGFIAIKKVGKKPFPIFPLKIAGLNAMSQSGDEINRDQLTYMIKSIYLNENLIKKHDFEIVGSELRLKNGKTLSKGKLQFHIGVKLKSEEEVSTIASKSFKISIVSPLKTVTGQPVSRIIGPIKKETPTKLADLNTINQSGDKINVDQLTYKIKNILLNDNWMEKDDFEIQGSELRWKGGKKLENGLFSFRVSAQLKVGWTIIDSNPFTLLVSEEESTFPKKVIIMSSFGLQMNSIDEGKEIPIKIADLITIDQNGNEINVDQLTYKIDEVSHNDVAIISKFRILDSKLWLKNDQTLEKGVILIKILATLKDGGEVIKSSCEFSVI